MMRYIRYLIIGVIVLCLVVMAMANWQTVTLTVLPAQLAELARWNYTTPELPLFLVVLGGVAIGVLLGYILEWMRESKHRSEVSKRQRQVKDLNREVTRLKGETNKDKDEVLALLEDSGTKRAI